MWYKKVINIYPPRVLCVRFILLTQADVDQLDILLNPINDCGNHWTLLVKNIVYH